MQEVPQDAHLVKDCRQGFRCIDGGPTFALAGRVRLANLTALDRLAQRFVRCYDVTQQPAIHEATQKFG